MAGIYELKQLQTQILRKNDLVGTLQKEEQSFKAKLQSFRKPLTPIKAHWRFNLFLNGLSFTTVAGGLYAMVYAVAYGLMIVGAIFLFPLIFFGVSASFLDTILYYLGFPATWFGGLILPWIRNAGLKPDDVGLAHIGYFFVGLILLIGAILLSLFILDLLIMALRNPSVTAANKKIRDKNLKASLMDDFAAEEWRKSTDRKAREQKIKSFRSNVVDVANVVARNTTVHNDYKNAKTIRKLIHYKRRLKERVGALEQEDMRHIDTALAISIGLSGRAG